MVPLGRSTDERTFHDLSLHGRRVARSGADSTHFGKVKHRRRAGTALRAVRHRLRGRTFARAGALSPGQQIDK